jgi:hypothetical protein
LQVEQVTVVPVMVQTEQAATKEVHRAHLLVTEFSSIWGEELQTQEVPEAKKVDLQLVQRERVQLLQLAEQAMHVPAAER